LKTQTPSYGNSFAAQLTFFPAHSPQRLGSNYDSPALQMPFIPPRWWETARESDQPAVVMLECDVNLYYCSARQSRNGGQWSRRNLHGGKVRRGGPVAVTAGKRCSIYSSLGMSTSMTVSRMSK
jgi:hypothetical protein